MDQNKEFLEDNNFEDQPEITTESPELEIIKEVKDEDLDFEQFSREEESPFLIGAKKVGLFVFEIVKVVLISLAIILPVRMFLIQPFYVEGASMEPSFYNSEYLIIDEISYRFQKPQRGEVVVFRNPKNPKEYFIKRVIGLPGEKVEVKDGVVYINDQELKENSYIEDLSTQESPSLLLGPDEYFVLGDNRVVSYDSRRFKAVNEKYIIGRVWFRGWPLDRIATFNIPNYGNIQE